MISIIRRLVQQACRQVVQGSGKNLAKRNYMIHGSGTARQARDPGSRQTQQETKLWEQKRKPITAAALVLG